MDTNLPNPSPPAPSKARGALHAHNSSHNRYLITGDLVLTHAMHIGSGRGDLETDALVIVDGGNQPIIPGSSLRGVLRAHTERALATLQMVGSPYWACGLYETETPNDRICVGNLSHQASKKRYDELLKEEERQPDVIWKKLETVLCDACRLFGAGSIWASPLRVADLPLTSGGSRQIRHGVGIHRDTGTAAPGIKYDRQVVDAGAKFSLEIVAENLDEVDRAILALALSHLISGELALGGGTGRGLGRCRLEGASVRWVDMTNRQDLIAYLISGAGAPREQRFPNSSGVDEFIKDNLPRLIPAAETGG